MTTGTSSTNPTALPLSWQIRADLFAQLAALEKSGLPTIQAVAQLNLPPPHQSRSATMRKWLERGSELATAGRRSGMFTEMEAQLIHAASNAGNLPFIYKRLAERYAQRVAQLRIFKSRMALPVAVFVIGLLVQPLPALFGGTLSVGGYLLRSLSPLVVIAILIMLLKKLFALNEHARPASGNSLESLAMSLPILGKSLIRRNIRDYLESLALMLEAGIPILEALPKALDTIRLHAVKQAFSGVRFEIERGGSLTQALAEVSYMDREQALALINAGEASGNLPEMLFHYAAVETQALAESDKQLAEWLPRIIYAAIAAWIMYGLLSGPGFGPRLPADLG